MANCLKMEFPKSPGVNPISSGSEAVLVQPLRLEHPVWQTQRPGLGSKVSELGAGKTYSKPGCEQMATR